MTTDPTHRPRTDGHRETMLAAEIDKAAPGLTEGQTAKIARALVAAGWRKVEK